MEPTTPKLQIHAVLDAAMSGEAIEARSFEIIDREIAHATFDASQWAIVRRMIHACGDPAIADTVRFSPDAVRSAIRALHESAPIVVDAQMIRAGLSAARLRRARETDDSKRPSASIACHIADDDVARESKRTGLPRSLFALRKARSVLDGAIAVFGNSPVALLELNRMIVEEGLRPAVVIGFPVGFVHVVEAKEELERMPVPFITLRGRRGGSPLAVAALHALCELARADTAPFAHTPPSDSSARPPSVGGGASHTRASVAVILMGHGSRAPGAARAMEDIAMRLRANHGFTIVEVCYMSQARPSLDEAIERCVTAGARRAIVLPYFLHDGVHLREDIPALLRERAAHLREHDGMTLHLGRPLGYDPVLVDLVARRIDEAAIGAGWPHATLEDTIDHRAETSG